MAPVAHKPVQQAMSRIRVLSADEEARRLAFVTQKSRQAVHSANFLKAGWY